MNPITPDEDTGDCDFEGLDLELDPGLSAILKKYELPGSPTGTPRPDRGESQDTNDTCCQQSKNTKSWHQRRREEILRLRVVAKELSDTLRQKRVEGTFSSTFQGIRPRRGSSSLMEDLARRQLVRLEKSTEENARLRGLVRRRELQIKAVERAFKRRLRATSSLTISKPRLRCTDSIPPLRNIEIFTDLIAGMDEVYADLDNFFRQVKMHEVACPGRRNNSAKYQDRNIFFELLDCYALPFDLRQTEQAIWTLKTTPVGKTDDVSAEYFAADENTRMKCACITSARQELPRRVVIHVAVRKYVEQDRTVFVSRMLVEPIQDLFAVAFKETTRLVLKRGRPSATGPTTVMQTHCRATDHEQQIMRQGNAQRGQVSWKATPYYESGARAWENSIGHFNLRVEDMLVRESILPQTDRLW